MFSRHPKRAAWLTALTLVLASSVALGQPAKPKKEDGTVAEARARFEEGVRLGSAGDHEAARLKFNQAWSLIKTANVVYNLARAERFSNHPVEALEHFRTFLKMSDDPKSTEAMRTHAAEYVAELTAQVGQIEIVASTRAKVTVDGRAVETGELVPVVPGKHVVQATLEDGTQRTLTLDCLAGSIVKAQLTDDEVVAANAPPPPPPAPAAPLEASPYPAPAPPALWSTARVAGAATAGVGLAALAAGVFVHLAASDSADEAEDIRERLPGSSACSDAPSTPDCTRLKSLADEQKTEEVLRGAFLIGGAVFLAGGAALFILGKPKAEARASTRIVPIATPHHAGLSLVGSF